MSNDKKSLEEKIKESQEWYRDKLASAKDPDYRPEGQNYKGKNYVVSLRIPRKYWANELGNLNTYERNVLCTYASYMNKERIAWPSFRTIAKVLKINPRTVRKSYQGLIEKVIIKSIGLKKRVHVIKIL